MSRLFRISDFGFRIGRLESTRAPIRNAKSGIRNRPTAPAHAGGAGERETDLPCRSANRAAWKYALLAGVFLVWLAFLIWVAAS
jgi:hypothetical protein